MAKVIILEDDAVLGPLLQASLEDFAHDVRLFTTAHEAIAGFEEEAADIVVADAIIVQDGKPAPEGGIVATSTIKSIAEARNHRVGVIAISGSHVKPGMSFILNTMEVVGADAALAKPFTPDELLTAIDQLLAEMG